LRNKGRKESALLMHPGGNAEVPKISALYRVIQIASPGPSGINARGQIAGLGFEFRTGSVRAVLMNPHDRSNRNKDFAPEEAAIAAKPALKTTVYPACRNEAW
jgi:hypothetical protein